MTAGNFSIICNNIQYFSDDEYAPDPNDSTGAIPYAAKRAATFIMASSAILVMGALLCIIGHTCSRRRVFTFTSGIAFVISGLMILAGMVIYIATFKSEVGNKLRPKSTFVPPLFTYEYGYSFHLAVASLMLCEVTGTLSIFHYILVHKIKWKQELDRQAQVMGLPIPSLTLQPAAGHPDGVPAPPLVYCRKHGRGRRYSRSLNIGSRESSPTPRLGYGDKLSPRNSLLVPEEVYGLQMMRRDPRPGRHLSDSMRDLTYFNFPPSASAPLFSRDATCQTVSTAADVSRNMSRDFSYQLPSPPMPPGGEDDLDYDNESENEDDNSLPRNYSYDNVRMTPV
ncbi:Voltage-dependent calcium channel gamma-5 subunit [Halotydeus destructor]|nr:Voltage-dependent calcium channel gamma-5 subunit [Halotydeus destructor]